VSFSKAGETFQAFVPAEVDELVPVIQLVGCPAIAA
jgi:hypothetical protein